MISTSPSMCTPWLTSNQNHDRRKEEIWEWARSKNIILKADKMWATIYLFSKRIWWLLVIVIIWQNKLKNCHNTYNTLHLGSHAEETVQNFCWVVVWDFFHMVNAQKQLINYGNHTCMRGKKILLEHPTYVQWGKLWFWKLALSGLFAFPMDSFIHKRPREKIKVIEQPNNKH